jgi:cytidylate kinase
MIITIDGPAGSGKSEVALHLAERLGVPHLDTGAMYRAVALDALEQNLLDDPDAMGRRCPQLDLRFDWSQRPAPIWLNGRDVSGKIRLPDVTAVTYRAADNVAVRNDLVKRQRAIGREAGSLVTEGRDQGSIVFPYAEYKFYLDAAVEERARRRCHQLTAKGVPVDPDQVLADLRKRDEGDTNRVVGGLVLMDDSIHLDTTPMTLEAVVDEIYRIVTTGDRK